MILHLVALINFAIKFPYPTSFCYNSVPRQQLIARMNGLKIEQLVFYKGPFIQLLSQLRQKWKSKKLWVITPKPLS